MNKLEKATKFEFEVGSNVIKVDGKEVFLSIIVWDKNATYESVKEYIVK